MLVFNLSLLSIYILAAPLPENDGLKIVGSLVVGTVVAGVTCHYASVTCAQMLKTAGTSASKPFSGATARMSAFKPSYFAKPPSVPGSLALGAPGSATAMDLAEGVTKASFSVADDGVVNGAASLGNIGNGAALDAAENTAKASASALDDTGGGALSAKRMASVHTQLRQDIEVNTLLKNLQTKSEEVLAASNRFSPKNQKLLESASLSNVNVGHVAAVDVAENTAKASVPVIDDAAAGGANTATTAASRDAAQEASLQKLAKIEKSMADDKIYAKFLAEQGDPNFTSDPSIWKALENSQKMTLKNQKRFQDALAAHKELFGSL